MSNLTKRILAGIAGIPLIISASYFGGIYFLIFSIIVVSFALWEYCEMFQTKGYHLFKISTLFLSTAMLIIGYALNYRFEIIFFPVFIFFTAAEILRKDNRNPLNAAIVIFGLLYVTVPFMMLNSFVKDSSGFNVIILIFILIWTCDTAAYFGGKYFGKHQLSSISPKKTWEGSAAGFVFTVAAALLVHSLIPGKISLTDAVIMGIITGIFAQIGDLFESLIKRFCGVKDSSNIIPGHGGVLDRFDSLIFVTPLIFLYLNIK